MNRSESFRDKPSTSKVEDSLPSPEVARRAVIRRISSPAVVAPLAGPPQKEPILGRSNPLKVGNWLRRLGRGFHERFIASSALNRHSLEERLLDAQAVHTPDLNHTQVTDREYWAAEEIDLLRDREELGQPAPAVVYRFSTASNTLYVGMVLEGQQKEVIPVAEHRLDQLVSVKIYTDKSRVRQQLIRFTYHNFDDPSVLTTGVPAPMRHVFLYMSRKTQDRLLVDLAAHRLIYTRPVQRPDKGLVLAMVPYWGRVRAFGLRLTDGGQALSPRQWRERMKRRLPVQLAELYALARDGADNIQPPVSSK